MFRQRGWTAIINDDIIETVTRLGNTFIGSICSICSLLYAQERKLSHINSTILILSGYFIGHLMSSIASKVISSAVATIFVCFAEKPHIFQV